MPDTPEQPQQQSYLTLDDLIGAGLNELLDQDPASDYNDLYGKLAKAAGNAKAAGDLAKAHALGFIAAIASMMLTPTEKSAPFQALAHWTNGAHSFIPEDLTPAQVNLAAQLAGAVNHQLLRARLADLVWLRDRSKGIAFPRMAIDAYRSHPINFDTWLFSGEAVWHRALGLAISLGSGAENRAAEIEAALLDAFNRALGTDTFEPMFYVRPLFAEKRARAEAPRIAGELERLGRERLAAGLASNAEAFFDEAEKWYERAQLADKQAEMLAQIGASLAAQAEAATSAIARQEFITRAIKAYRDVPGAHRVAYRVEEIIAELRAKLAAAGRLALGEMKEIRSGSIDLTEFVRKAVQRVQGKTPMNALLAFCTIQPFPKRESLYQQAQ